MEQVICPFEVNFDIIYKIFHRITSDLAKLQFESFHKTPLNAEDTDPQKNIIMFE